MNKNQTIKKLTNELNELKGKYSQIQIELGEKSKEIDVLFKMICLKWCFRWFLIKMTQSGRITNQPDGSFMSDDLKLFKTDSTPACQKSWLNVYWKETTVKK